MEILTVMAPFLPWVGVVGLWWRITESKKKMAIEHEKEFRDFKDEVKDALAELKLQDEKNRNYGALCSNFKHVNSK